MEIYSPGSDWSLWVEGDGGRLRWLGMEGSEEDSERVKVTMK